MALLKRLRSNVFTIDWDESVLVELRRWAISLTVDEKSIVDSWNQSHWELDADTADELKSLNDEIRRRQSESWHANLSRAMAEAPGLGFYMSWPMLSVLCMLTARLASRKMSKAQRGVLEAPFNAVVGLIEATRRNPEFAEFALALVSGWSGSLAELMEAGRMTSHSSGWR